MISAAPNVIIIPAKGKIRTSSAENAAAKVAAYCRVSTEEENQRNSYAAQISYYTDYIASNPDWQLVGIFADEGISGTRTKNRVQFNKMIKMARRKQIDIILCKSISRFARNTVDCLDYVRELKSLGVTVIFEKENINTSSVSSEFAISLYASFAQAESESISKNVTWGIEKSFREGKVRYQFNQMLGYRLGDDGKPHIIDDEADIVRFIFREYASGSRSSEIAEKLMSMGAKRRNGSTEWTRNHVYQILKNEKYAGDAILQKSYTVSCITHVRRINHGEKPMYFIQDCHEAIVDRKTYDTVRLELEKRKRDARRGTKERGKYVTKYCMSRLLVCPYCGGFYKRTIWLEKSGKIGVWRCKNRMEGKKCSRSPSYHENELQKAVISAVNKMISKMELVSFSAEESRRKLAESCTKTDSSIKAVNKRLAEIIEEREAILSSVSGSIFEEMSDELKELNRQEGECADQLEKLRGIRDDCKRNILREEAAVKLLKGMKPLSVFDENLLGGIISKIEAVNKNEIKVTLVGGYTVVQEI